MLKKSYQKSLLLKVSKKLKEAGPQETLSFNFVDHLADNKDAGLVKDLITWAGITLTTLFGTFQTADATPKDFHNFLKKVEVTLEKGNKDINVDTSFDEKREYGQGAGSGNFKINFDNVYIIQGKYDGTGDAFNSYDIVVKRNPNADPEKIKKWKPKVYKMKDTIKDLAPDLLNQ